MRDLCAGAREMTCISLTSLIRLPIIREMLLNFIVGILALILSIVSFVIRDWIFGALFLVIAIALFALVLVQRRRRNSPPQQQ